MLESGLVLDEPLASVNPARQSEGRLWAIVLAGGEGRRLAPLTRQLYGDGRPKQYAALIGSRSLLRQTVDRVALLIPPRRTVVVTMASHAEYLEAELLAFPDVHVLSQPSDRGTAAGILLAALWIRARDPRASVVVFPADHFISDEAAFMRHVGEVATFVKTLPQWLVLLGVAPTMPEADYGWIEPAEQVGWTTRGLIHRVRRFREKPLPELAQALFASGCLWNTFVLASSAAALLDAGRRCVPLLYDRLVATDVFVDTVNGRWRLRQAYLFAPAADFSRAVLESPKLPLAVSEIPGVTWCDLGSPGRVTRILQTLSDHATRGSGRWSSRLRPEGR